MVAVENLTENKLYDDLRGFLRADRVDLRRAATEAVLQVRDFHEMEKIIKHGLVSDLAKNTSYPDNEVSIQALKGLVQLSSHGTSANQCVEDLMEAGGLNRMLEIALSTPDGSVGIWKQKVNYAMSLMANITRTESGSINLVGLTMPEEAVTKEEAESREQETTKPTVELILARFLASKFIDETDYSELEGEALDSDAADPYQHFAAVLMNATQVEAGRQFCMKIHREKVGNVDQSWTVLEKLLPQLKSINPLRRRGIAGLVRNCCLDQDSSWWLLNVVKVTKHILYPLAGPEELDIDEKKGLDPDLWLEGPDKKREADHFTRLFLVESILLLCATGRKSREQLRLDRVYVILKWADMVEEHEDVSERINECVQFLRRDEEGTAEGSSDKFVSDAYNKPSLALQVGMNEDFDDVD